MNPQLTQALASGALVLTATRRLARWLRQRHDEAQRQARRMAWESPRIAAFADWLREAWDEAQEAAPGAAETVLLSNAQCEVLWEETLLADPEAGTVLHPRAAAALALKAWELSRLWQLPEEQAQDESPDTAAFARWREAYLSRCAQRGWTDAARLPEMVAEALRLGHVETPSAVMLAGFDDLPPAYRAVVAALEGRRCNVTTLDPPAWGSRAVVSPWPDAEAEAEAAARWARHWLEVDTPAPIGIVIPDLSERRAQIERLLREVLEPGVRYPRDPGEGLYNISQGVPLAEVPLVRSALTLLRLREERLPLDVAGHVLRTPYLADAESERCARGLLEARLRELGELEPSAATLAHLAAPARSGPRPWHCPGLAAALARAWSVRDGLPRAQSCGAWAQAFDAWLAALGWPGERPLDSVEHQAREKWQTLLEAFAHLERVLPPLTWGEALSRLMRLAAQTPFQPETRAAPVQVLGLLESGGLEFAHLWVMGLDGDTWPPPPRPNPFLPLALQRRIGLPGSSAARQLDYARRHTERLCQSAPDVVFSHALRRDDEELRASPLLAALPQAVEVPRSTVVTLAGQLRQSATLEPWTDVQAPPIPPHESAVGGTSLFRDMAACPFRAFAQHRLHASTLAEPVPGLGADRRGELAHRALEFLWRSLGDHGALSALTPQGARELAIHIAQAAIGACEEKWRRKLPDAVAALEAERITTLLLELLEVERKRPPFRVAVQEESREATLGGVRVQMRIDRVDELSDGRRLLLDYKTGRPVGVAAWFSERPDEPQLPVYAVTSPQPVHGLGFVRVRHGDAGFICMTDGFELPRRAAPPGNARASKPQARFSGYRDKATGQLFSGREAVLDHWRAALEALGERFRAGDAAVDPKQPGKTCETCGLPALCRIDALRQWGGEEENDDQADGG